tara:strand:+ start:336 stop:548 length:213 start_codon:yes stop_codon:yes gene_type:complete
MSNKYGIFENHIDEAVEPDGNTAKNYFLFLIANELAESNRLKRLELETLDHSFKLTDQAIPADDKDDELR